MLTIVTFAYGRNYTFWHAENLRTMLERNLTIPWRMKVVTDALHEFRVAGFDAVKLWEVNAALRQRNRPAGHTFAKLALFDKNIGGSLGDRLLYLPLDCIIRGNIDDLAPTDETAVKVTRFMWSNVAGGPLYVRPGAVQPCPWNVITYDPDIGKRIPHGDTANGLLTYMLCTTAPTWSEIDGININGVGPYDWRIFIRTGNQHVWNHGQPEQAEYLKACGLTPAAKVASPAAPAPPKPVTQFIVRPRNKLLRKDA